MTYEEYLCTLEIPVVFSVEYLFGTSFLSEESMSTFPNTMTNIRHAPHVQKISYPTYLHWLGSVIRVSRLMIGQYQSALQEEQISEGRKWEDMAECCVNRALYEKLLESTREEFSGLGDTVDVKEVIYGKSYRHMPDGSRQEELEVRDTFSFSLTVVGIIDEEGEYADTDAYGFYHIYASIDLVKTMIAKHSFTHPNKNDESAYLPSQIYNEYAGDAVALFSRPRADDPAKKELRLPGNRIIPEEEWLSYFENVPVNAGYIMEITLDSGTGYAEFKEYMEKMDGESSAKFYYDYQYKVYEVNKENNKNNPNWVDAVNMPQILEEIAADGELDEWYYYRPVPRVIRPLRVAGD